MDKPWKSHAKDKKPDTKGHVLYDFIFVKSPNGKIQRDR